MLLFLLPSANGQEKFRIPMLNVCYAAWTRGKVPQRRRPKRNKQHHQIKNSTIMNQIKHPNQLDDSNGSIKVTHNKAMQSASQTPGNGQVEKKSPLKCQGIGKKAIIAILALATVLSPISALAVHPVVAFRGETGNARKYTGRSRRRHLRMG